MGLLPDTDTAALLERFPIDFAADPQDPDIAQRRDSLERMVRLYGLPPSDKGRDVQIAGKDAPIRLRVYGAEAGANRAIVLNLHGGGWVLGGPDAYSGVMEAYRAAGDCLVVDVDYRRAPEHLYPAALDDCLSALDWLFDHAVELGGDPAKVIVTGDSAGGYLAARLALTAGERLAGLVLVYPVLAVGKGHNLPSREALGDGRFFLSHDVILRAETEFFAPGMDLTPPALSPVLASDSALKDLPPTMIVAAGLDPLRDEAELFARRIHAAGGDVRWRVAEGTIHAFVLFAGAIAEGREVIAEIGSFVRKQAGGVR